jgi:hypothetical protein
MKHLTFLFGIVFLLTSCYKEEIVPQLPTTQPTITDSSFVDNQVTLKNTTWVITKVLNTQMDEDFPNDTLKFITETEYKFNGVKSTYSFYPTNYGFKLNLNNTEWGHIGGTLYDHNITQGLVSNRDFFDIFTGDQVLKIWMYKL